MSFLAEQIGDAPLSDKLAAMAHLVEDEDAFFRQRALEGKSVPPRRSTRIPRVATWYCIQDARKMMAESGHHPDLLSVFVHEWNAERTARWGEIDPFVTWLKTRLVTRFPFPETTRLVLQKIHGKDVTRWVIRQWRAEVALAHVMRDSPNPRVMMLAGLWLKLAELSPHTAILGVAEALWKVGTVTYGSDEHEILNRPVPRGIRPAWLLHAEKVFGQVILEMVKLPVHLVARERQRGKEEAEAYRHEGLRVYRQDIVRTLRPSRVPSVLMQAARLGLTSNQLKRAETRFVKDERLWRQCFKPGRDWRMAATYAFLYYLRDYAREHNILLAVPEKYRRTPKSRRYATHRKLGRCIPQAWRMIKTRADTRTNAEWLWTVIWRKIPQAWFAMTRSIRQLKSSWLDSLLERKPPDDMVLDFGLHVAYRLQAAHL